MKRTNNITFKVSNEEKFIINNLCDYYRMTKREFLMMLIEKHREDIREEDRYYRMIKRG